MPDTTKVPGKGMMGWLGRQVGYISQAVKRDPGGQRVVMRLKHVEQHALPVDPSVTLRRSIIDEVILDPTNRPTGNLPPKS